MFNRLSLLEGNKPKPKAVGRVRANYMHQNPYWGTPRETHDKVKIYYDTSIMSPKPVPGALEGVKALKEMGYKLVIITARHTEEQPLTQKWLDQYFPGKYLGPLRYTNFL